MNGAWRKLTGEVSSTLSSETVCPESPDQRFISTWVTSKRALLQLASNDSEYGAKGSSENETSKLASCGEV